MRDVTDYEARPLCRIQSGRIDAAKADCSRHRWELADDGLHKRSFSNAITADHGNNFSRHVMLDHDNRHARRVEIPDEIRRASCFVDRLACGRLIEQQEIGFSRYRKTDRKRLLLSLRKLPHGKIFCPCQSNPGQDGSSSFQYLCFRMIAAQRREQVLESGQFSECTDVLEFHRETAPGSTKWGEPVISSPL